MVELFAFSQIIKNISFYKTHREQIHQVYLELGRSKKLTPEQIKRSLRDHFFTMSHMLLAEINDHRHQFNKTYQDHVLYSNNGLQFATYGEAHYPTQCYLMEDPPLTLSYLGRPVWEQTGGIAVVGSREPSADSLKWMEKELGEFCVSSQSLIISGGARGIDQKAHSIALRKSCPTIVVLPSGLGEVYPESLKEWVHPVLAGGGCFVSEYDYRQPMHKRLFHHRNRLIAALGKASLLIEAKRKSGTLITAQQAAQLGRPVWVVPGHPYDPHFTGGLDLLSEGAIMIRDAQDLLMFYRAELLNKEG